LKHKFITHFHNLNYPKTICKIRIEEPHLTKVKLKGSPINHKLTEIHRINTHSKNDIINFKIQYQNLVKESYENKLDLPGLLYVDEDVLIKQEQIIGFIIKKIGSNLLSGKSIMNVSLPVNIFDPRTLLQVYAYELSFAPIYLSRAFYSYIQIEKIKWVTVFLISQLHLSPLQTKPFNPIIGETFQCKIGNMNVYLEQTINKPPTCNLYAFSDDGNFKVYGNIITYASTSMNSVKAEKQGKYIVEFSDGGSFELYFPTISIKGTTIGSRIFNFVDCASVIDRKYDLAVYLKFNPDERNSIIRFFGGKQKTYPDTFRYYNIFNFNLI
jgi:hypothetical protein